MGYIAGVHLLPATGEFTYDTIAYSGQRSGSAMAPINTFQSPGGSRTDYSYAIDQLQAAHPECHTVAIVCAWFADSLSPATCRIYPATTYMGGSFQRAGGAGDSWRVSGLTQTSPGLIPLPSSGSGYVYGGTPSDQSLVRCILDLKSRGFKVIFYPFLLMTAAGYPWRGSITHAPDVTPAATDAVNAFLGSASAGNFTADPVNLTVAYSGSPTDFTYRRMVLHYAWLCTIAGGVNLFLLGSELRGLESIRGPSWTPAGSTDGAGHAVWDYPFVAGLSALANDVRGIFDSRGLGKNIAALVNLIAYSADWSSWMGFQHPGANGQWPHLDALWASSHIDIVGFDNYLPLSDWTTGSGGLDAFNWLRPAPSGSWPPPASNMDGLGQSGPPTLRSLNYLKSNIEGGEKFNWYYSDGANLGAGLDPSGSDIIVSLPSGDRLSQARNAYSPDQQLLANKQVRWWWNNPHRAIYDNGDGSGWSPHGPNTPWVSQSKSIAFIEYGFPGCDKGTNQPNVFFDAKSTQSATPYWSTWQALPGGEIAPQRDDTLAALALQAVYQYWNADGHNAVSAAGTPMVQFDFSCVWNWDARPFPAFPLQSGQWADAANWQSGNWQNGRGPALPPPAASSAPSPGSYAAFPSLDTLGWSAHMKPRFDVEKADHISGRSTRASRNAVATYDIELSFDLLRGDPARQDMQTLAGFFNQMSGAGTPFWLSPPGVASVVGQTLGIGNGSTTTFALTRGYGSYSEPVAGTSGVRGVYINGAVVAPPGWSVSAGYAPRITFATAPADGAIVSADFNALWLCRFAEDVLDFEEFLSMLFELRTIKLTTVSP